MTGDGSLLKRINRMALVRLVKAEPGLSRADLAKRTGLTKSTVSVLVAELVDEGWLREGSPPAGQGLGRRPTPLAIDPSRLGLLGAELGVDYLNVVACSLRGEVLSSRSLPYQHRDVARSVKRLCDLIAEAHAVLRGRRCRPLGVGVAIPGMVDVEGQRLRVAPNIGWHDVDLAALVRQGLDASGCAGLPQRILNDANAAALGQHLFGDGHRDAPLVYLHLGIGVGAGIVMGDRIYLGNDGLAGEVGHTTLHPDGPACGCGRRGCAELYVSQRAVSRGASGASAAGAPVLPIGELVRRARAGDEAVLRAVKKAADHLGLLLQNLCYTVNPAEIVLGGPLAELGDLLVEAGVSAMRARAGRYDQARVTVRRCALGHDACAVGAASSVLHGFLNVDA